MDLICAKRRIERRFIDDEHVDLCLHRSNELGGCRWITKTDKSGVASLAVARRPSSFPTPHFTGVLAALSGGRFDRGLVVVPSPWLKLVGLNIAANIMFLEAVKRSPLGLTVPYLALTPLVAAIAALFFGYGLSVWGWSGIVILTLGTVWLHPHDPRYGLLTPLLRLKEESGSGLMVVVALAWGFTAILDQSAVQHIPPALHALILAVGMFIAGVMGFYRAKREQKETYPSVVSPWVLGTGAMMAIAMVAQFEAFTRIDVAVVEAVKRIIGTTSAVVLGVVFYGEKEFTRRLIASALMGVGAAILVLSL